MKNNCKIRILDEVTAVLVGLEDRHMTILSDKFAVHAKNYFFNPLFKLGQWDGKIRYLHKTGRTYVHLLDQILPILVGYGYKIDIEDLRTTPFETPAPITNEAFAHIKHIDTGKPIMLRDDQVIAVNSLIEHGSGICLAGTGAGKATSLDTLILTTNGWRAMRHIQVGDTLIAPDNTVTSVTGVYPQGITEMFDVVFEDGANLHCTGDHLWEIRIGQSEKAEIINTNTIKRMLEWPSTTSLHLSIPMVDPIGFKDFETAGLVPGLVRAKLTGGVSRDDLYAPIEYRHQVLESIIEGFARPRNGLTNPVLEVTDDAPGRRLALNIQELARSLGYLCSIKDSTVEIGYNNREANNYRRIVSVTKIDDAESQCIAVDHPRKLFITAGFVVTHNTLMCSALVQAYDGIDVKSITIVPDQTLIRQTKAEYVNCGLDTGEYSGATKTLDHKHVVTTWQALKNNPKIIELFHMVIVDECLAGDTMVLMADGTHKEIQDIRPGDKVTSYHAASQMLDADIVVKLHTNLLKSESEKMYLLKFTHDIEMQVTGNHQILTTVGYIRADMLTEQHVALSTTDGPTLISRVEIDKPAVTYNLHVENNHNYIANGIVVSNCHGLRGNVLTKIVCDHASKLPYRFGFTGTIPKDEGEKMAVHVAVGPVRHTMTARTLIDMGVLANIHIDVIQLEENFKKQYEDFCSNEDYSSDFPNSKKPTYAQFKDGYFPDFTAEKNYFQKNKARIEWIAELILAKQNAASGITNTLCLVDNIATGRALAALVPGSIFVNGQDVKKSADRDVVYNMFKTRDDLVVFATVNVAGTGLSINRIFNLVFVDVGKSFIRVIQGIGRGLRKSSDKDSVVVTDICGDLKYSKKHLKDRIEFYEEAQYPFKKHKVDYTNDDV